MGKKYNCYHQNNLNMSNQLKKETVEICTTLLEVCTSFKNKINFEYDQFVKIFELTELLREKQKNFVKIHKNRKKYIKEFMAWLQKNGAIFENVILYELNENDFGLQLTKEFKMNDLVIQIPNKIILSQTTAKNSFIGQLLKDDKIIQCMPNVLVALHLLCEFFSINSFWKPYIDILPDHFNTILYFNLEDIQLLKGSPAFYESMNHYTSIVRQYSYFFKLFQTTYETSQLPIKYFCFDDYRWAVSTVQTRQNRIGFLPELEFECCLIPLIDMCNHSVGMITTGYNKEKCVSECFAMKDFNDGEELTIYYGERSNSEFLLHNGFIPDENSTDKLTIKLGISKNDSLYSMKAELLARIPINSNFTFYLHDCENCPVDADLIAFLRIFHMNIDQLRMYLMGENAPLYRQQLLEVNKPVDFNNETNIWTFLKTRCELLKKCYPEENLINAENQSMTETKKMIKKLLDSEKNILSNTVQFCEIHLLKLHDNNKTKQN